MYKLKAKVLISKNPTCNCGGYYHPNEVFFEKNEHHVKRYIAKDWVEVLEEPKKQVIEKEEKQVRKTKELKV